MNIPCAGCGALNRVPAERLGDGPICGACKQPLLPAEPVALDERGFSAFLSRSDLPVVVDFWAEWCGPCKSMAPQFAQAARLLQGRAILAKLDTEAAPGVAGAHAIRSIPTLAMFRQGREVAREAGLRPSADIVRWVEGLL